MEKKEIIVKRIKEVNTIDYFLFILLDQDNIQYQFIQNIQNVSPDVEVLALAEVGDVLRISYTVEKVGPLDMYVRNKIFNVQFENK